LAPSWRGQRSRRRRGLAGCCQQDVSGHRRPSRWRERRGNTALAAAQISPQWVTHRGRALWARVWRLTYGDFTDGHRCRQPSDAAPWGAQPTALRGRVRAPLRDVQQAPFVRPLAGCNCAPASFRFFRHPRVSAFASWLATRKYHRRGTAESFARPDAARSPKKSSSVASNHGDEAVAQAFDADSDVLPYDEDRTAAAMFVAACLDAACKPDMVHL